MLDKCCGLKVALAALIIAATACVADQGYANRSAEEWATLLERAPDPQDRIRAANAFYHSPPQTYGIVHRLLVAGRTDPDSTVRAMMRRVMGRLPEQATAALIKSLEDSSALVRRGAADAIGRMTHPSAKAVRPLIARTADPDDSVKVLAVVALGGMGSTAYEARDTLRKLAENPGPMRAAALAALPEVDTEADTFIGLFDAAMGDSSEAVRIAATTNALAGARSPHHDPVPLLIRALSDRSAAVRIAAIQVLMRTGPRAQAALPRLVELARSPDENEASLAAAAVQALGGQVPRGARRQRAIPPPRHGL